MDKSRADFEAWATTILGDNPTWRESAFGELARQAWQASRKQALEEVAARAPARSEATCGLARDQGLIEHQQQAAIRSLEGNAKETTCDKTK